MQGRESIAVFWAALAFSVLAHAALLYLPVPGRDAVRPFPAFRPGAQAVRLVLRLPEPVPPERIPPVEVSSVAPAAPPAPVVPKAEAPVPEKRKTVVEKHAERIDPVPERRADAAVREKEVSASPPQQEKREREERQAKRETRSTPSAVSSASAGVNALPRPAAAIYPTYPVLSRRRGEEGTVTVAVRVSADGRVEEVKVVRSSGRSRLDRAAVAAVRRARFIPAREKGRPVPGTTELTFRFRLTDGK